MKYFRIPQRFDNINVYKNGKLITCLVGGELYTKNECNKLGLNTKVLELVNISRKKTCFVFGVRFVIE